MDYYSGLHLEREPFSNSPDPGLFFSSKQHLEALQQLEISIRLKRGLAVVTGDVGTGKTTISRQLITRISGDPKLGYFLLLDPGFTTVNDFLTYLVTLFTGEEVTPGKGEIDLKERIKDLLFTRGVDEKKTTVLIIDEGQKLPLFCLEVLRELLNYETNSEKLLQTIIFAQKEMDGIIAGLPNFKDRINFRYCLAPLGFFETRQMIQYRLSRSRGPGSGKSLFSLPAHVAVYRLTRGYPRKIINLCHQVVLSLLIRNRTRAGWFLVKACGLRVFPEKKSMIGMKTIFAGLIVLAFLSAFFLKDPGVYLVRVAEIFKRPAMVDAPETVAETRENSLVEAPDALAEVPLYEAPVPVKSELAQTSVPLPESEPVSVAPMSEIYGSLRVPKDVTLCRMVETVYGRFNQKILAELLRVNPDIENPDIIRSGMSITFPAVDPQDDKIGKGWTREAFCLFFSKHSDFRNAYGEARELRAKDVDARVFPLWNPDKGFVFQVLLNRPFAAMDEAMIFKRQMPKLAGFRCAGLFSGGISETSQ